MPSFFNYFKKIKYYLIRNIETIPLINILILNNLYYFRYFLPHDKDYLGIKNLNLPSGLDIIDVGANIGASFLSFKSLKLKNKIHCFEPNPILVKEKLNFLKKKYTNLSVYNVALGKKNVIGTFFLPYYKNKPLHYFASFDKQYVINSCKITFSKNYLNKIHLIEKKVKLKKLDDYQKIIKPIFIKIDTEGFDLDVILGATKIIKKHKPILLIEYNSDIILKIKKKLPNYSLFYYDFIKDKFFKLKTNNINKDLISRHNKKNHFSYRNLYFIPNKR
tara:strand:- start:5107 stop:5934 length:828 start_codon:yes stop_codon:yes gene_type:complete